LRQKIKQSEANILFTSILNSKYNFNTTINNDSYIVLNDTTWKVKPNNAINYDSNTWIIKGLTFYASNQKILIDGKISSDPKDQVDVLFEKFRLSNLKNMIPQNVINIDGIVDGVVSLKKENDNLLFTSDLNFNQFRVNDNLIGEGKVKSSWNTQDRYLKLDGQYFREHIPTISFMGNYYPYKSEENLDFNLKLYQTNLDLFKVYTKEYISNLKGLANANIKLTGTFSEPKFNGKIDLMNTSFRVIYLNTNYHINNVTLMLYQI